MQPFELCTSVCGNLTNDQFLCGGWQDSFAWSNGDSAVGWPPVVC